MVQEQNVIPDATLNLKQETKMFGKITSLLETNGARFRVMEHEAAGKSEEIAKIRGNELCRSAKAMVVAVKMKSGEVQHVVTVLPASCQLNSKAIVKLYNAKSVSMVNDVAALTGCVSGSVPPFSFQQDITLLVDKRISDLQDGDIVFNAGELTKSIFLNLQDYLRITTPRIEDFSKDPTPVIASSSSIFKAQTEEQPDVNNAAVSVEAPGL